MCYTADINEQEIVMGQSTDGIIAFGIDLEEDLPESWNPYDSDDYDEDFDAEDWIIERQGAVPAVEVIRHCSGEYMMYILAIPGTELSASRGYPKKFDPSTLEIDPEKVQAFNAWIEKYIPEDERPDGGPSWLLFSMWW